MSADTWHKATCNWSELCVAMGCKKMQAHGALSHMYSASTTGTFYNVVHVQDPESFTIESIEKAFDEKKLPFTIKIPRLDSYTRLERSLRARGYSLVRVWDLMTLEENMGVSNPKVEVEDVDASYLMDWLATSNLSSLQCNIKHIRCEMIRNALLEKSTRLLLANLDGKSVGTGLLFSREGVASIHMISTVRAFRRMHVATTIVLNALDRLKNDEIDLTWLRTRRGGVGEKVYAKLGFKPLLDILTYTKTPSLDDVIVKINTETGNKNSPSPCRL